jgi:hypothetical protein
MTLFREGLARAQGRTTVRTLSWGLASWLLLALAGCSGTNVVAGEEQTKAEQLQSILPAWCDSACNKLQGCVASSDCACSSDYCSCASYEQDCPTECRNALAVFTQSDFCVEAGKRLMKCIDDASCSDLNTSLCAPTDEEESRCPTGGSATPDASSNAYPSMTGSDGGIAGSGDFTQPPRQAVVCNGADGGGSGGSAGSGAVAAVTCEEHRGDCSDGHEYGWLCARDSLGQTACSCLLDAAVVGAFKPGVDCPSLSDVDVGCDWALVENF